MTVKLQSRDRDLIAALDSRVEVFSFGQVGRGWWGRTEDPKGSVSRRLRTLARDGHVHVFETASGPEFDLIEPIFDSSSGTATPDFDAIRRVAADRSRSATTKCRFVSTSRGKAALMAEGAADMATHELNFATLYLRLREEVEEWRTTASLFDSQMTAALDSEGDRYEVVCSANIRNLEALVADCSTGLQVW